MTAAPQFPFAAVVGQDELKLALLLNAVDPRVGGVLLRGHKGSAKSTLARGLATFLPGSPPFVELPVGATEDRVVGTIDVAAALSGDGVRVQPGLLAAAHGGVLYIDEVNLLPDHLVDVLLDVAAGGVNRIEREGVSHEHASRFVLVGSMNPEEGDLRPQFLDRFGLAVDVASDLDPMQRAEAVRRRLAFDADPTGFVAAWAEETQHLRLLVAEAQPAEVDDELLVRISRLCAAVGVEGLRADLVITRAAAALAGLEGRTHAEEGDVRRVAPLALSHRRRRSPFEEPGIADEEIERALAPPDEPSDHESGRVGERSGDGGERNGDGGERTTPPGEAMRVRPLADGRRGPESAHASGRRSPAVGERGRLVGDRPFAAGEPATALAVGATVRAAATRGAPVTLHREDLRRAVRVERAGNLVVLAVDASASMGAERRMAAVKGAAMGLLLDAYQRRDRVALVTFGGDGARVALRPTGSVEVAEARLADLPTGGRTPLAAGIECALGLATAAQAGPYQPLLVLVTDGRATAATDGVEPLTAARRAAEAVRLRGVAGVVVDAEDGPTRLGLARTLAEAMGARYLTVSELSADALLGAVKKELS